MERGRQKKKKKKKKKERRRRPFSTRRTPSQIRKFNGRKRDKIALRARWQTERRNCRKTTCQGGKKNFRRRIWRFAKKGRYPQLAGEVLSELRGT